MLEVCRFWSGGRGKVVKHCWQRFFCVRVFCDFRGARGTLMPFSQLLLDGEANAIPVCGTCRQAESKLMLVPRLLVPN